MSFEFPCTHPADWACRPSPDDPTRCVGQAKYEAWVVAEHEMEQAKTDGKKLYFNTTENPNIVGNVDMTANDRKLGLGHIGPASPCCNAPGDEHEPGCVMFGRDDAHPWDEQDGL